MSQISIPVASAALSSSSWEIAGLCAVVVTLAGVWLRWRSQWHLSDIEEDLKNLKISADAAERRRRFVEQRAAALIFAGLGLMAVALVAAIW